MFFRNKLPRLINENFALLWVAYLITLQEKGFKDTIFLAMACIAIGIALLYDD